MRTSGIANCQKQKALQHNCHRGKAAKTDYEEEQTRAISDND